jgi:glycosyltransferase involved in cell wall biosynthesis
MSKLRILQVGTGMPRWAGTEKYILDLAPLLAARGHDTVIACRPESEIEKRSKQVGLPIVHLTMHHSHDWEQLPKFVRLMRGYDVVHIHSYVDYIVPAAAARVAQVPVIVMTRHLPHRFRNRWTAYMCSRLFYDGIIAVSEYVAEVLKSSGVRAERIFTVKNGIDPEPWASAAPARIREELGISQDSFLLAAGGRLAPGKGFDVLLRAVARVRKEGIDVNCVIAGGGDQSEFEAIRAQESLQRSAWLLGFRRDLPQLYSAADAVVVPSATPETFCYSALEGLASGKPVIASRIGGIPEIVNADCGILVPPDDVGALAVAITRLICDSELRRSLIAQAGRRGREFPLQAWASGVESVYNRVLSEKKKVSGSISQSINND